MTNPHLEEALRELGLPSGPVFGPSNHEAKAILTKLWNAALEEAAKVADKLEDDFAAEWKGDFKASSHMEGKSDGAGEVAAAIRALRLQGGEQ